MTYLLSHLFMSLFLILAVSFLQKLRHGRSLMSVIILIRSVPSSFHPLCQLFQRDCYLCVNTPVCPDRYSFDNQNHREFCIIEYPESPATGVNAVVVGNHKDKNGDKAEDLSQSTKPSPPASTKTPEQDTKRKDGPAVAAESTKKKKPFHCKPCHFQAQNEQEFVEHLRTHSISKMMVVNRVEGRSRNKAKEAEAAEAGEVEGSGDAAVTPADLKGLIRCERCGYNTNRYDHYIAHLKHHSKEGDDHRYSSRTRS